MNTFDNRLYKAMLAVKELPVDAVEQRMTDLVSLLTHIVNRETSGLYAITGISCVDQPYWRSFLSAARSVDFKLVGTDYYTAFFEHTQLPGKVIKVVFNQSTFGMTYEERAHYLMRMITTDPVS